MELKIMFSGDFVGDAVGQRRAADISETDKEDRLHTVPSAF
jgi:hypothetical protein